MNIIKELQKIREEKKILEIREVEIQTPSLSDFSKIKVIYSWFLKLAEEKRECPPEGTATHRKLFIYVILLLYSPSSLIGDKMKNGLRKEIAGALNIKRERLVTDNSSHVRALYATYADFRLLADYFYSEILFKIEMEK